MKKLMFLGGSAQQVPAIKYAKKKGYYLILCDYLSDNPGQYIVDKFHCVSTMDKEAVLKIAKTNSIDGIVAYASDPAAPTAAYVAEKLNLPSNPYESVKILTNKEYFRNFLSENNFFTPKAKGFSSISDFKAEINHFQFPLVIKPVDSSGSKGVSVAYNQNQLASKIDNALLFSKSKKFIVEEYVEMKGYQIAGDGFSIKGELIFRCFANDHFNTLSENPYVPISASFPYNGPNHVYKKIDSEIQRLFSLLELKDGAYNFDIRIDNDDNIYIMEIGPRNGGNFIPKVINYATGIDLIGATIQAALGEEVSNVKMTEPEGFWSYYVVHSLQEGVLKEISISEKVKKNNIVEAHLNYKIGDNIPAFTGANKNLGILIMKFKSMEEMLHMMDFSHEWINIIVE